MNRAPSPALRHLRHDPAERPMLVIWEATRACALACAHCRASAQTQRHPDELDTAAARTLIDQVAAFGRPSPIFVITGGDPLERADLPELIAYARTQGLPVAVSPAATSRLNRESLECMHSAGATALSLSLDGATRETHDTFRGVTGTYEQTMRAWEEARDVGMRVQINTTLSPVNVHELPQIAALVHTRGAMTWSVFLLVPVGRGTHQAEIPAREVEDVLNFLYDIGDLVPVKTTEGHHFRRVVLQRRILEAEGADHVSTLKLGPLYSELVTRTAELGLGEPSRVRRAPIHVSAGSGFVFVSHVGTVHPSGFFSESAGTVLRATLVDLYRDSELFRGVRDHTNLGGRCGYCEFAAVCGGSRSRALASTGDANASDPLCAYQPGSFPFPDRVRELVGP